MDTEEKWKYHNKSHNIYSSCLFLVMNDQAGKHIDIEHYCQKIIQKNTSSHFVDKFISLFVLCCNVVMYTYAVM